MHQQQQQQQERLSSGSLAAAYCIGLLTPTSHTAATIALDYSHILFQPHLQSWTNIIWNWWEFGKTKCVFFFLKSTKFSLVWTFWADLWHLSNEGSLICFHDVRGKFSTLGVSHPESLAEKIPTRKVFLQVLWRGNPIFVTLATNF